MSNNISEKSILDLIEEGKNNFVSSRFDDAANIFASAVRNLEKYEYDIDALYFSYAKIVALDKAGKKEQEIKSLKEMGYQCLNLAMKKAIAQQKREINLKQKSVYLNQTQEMMQILGHLEERESIVLTLVSLYKSIIKDAKVSSDEQELFQERIIKFCREYEHPKLDERKEKIHLAKLLENSGDLLVSSEKLHVDAIAADKYIHAASTYRDYQMLEPMKRLLRKALTCSKYGKFERYGFVKISRPERAKDEDGNEIDPDPDMAIEKINDYLRQLLNYSDIDSTNLARESQDNGE